jgi:Ca2+-binding RTX toxin-like protein
MKRVATIVGLGVLMLALAAGVAMAVLEVGNDNPNTLRGTTGDNKGQDTLFGLGAGDTLIGRSAADQLAGGPGPDRLEGNDGNDTLDGGIGEDRIFTGRGFDFVYARDGDRDHINCHGQTNYRIIFDANLDDIEGCPGANTNARSGAIVSRSSGAALSVE